MARPSWYQIQTDPNPRRRVPRLVPRLLPFPLACCEYIVLATCFSFPPPLSLASSYFSLSLSLAFALKPPSSSLVFISTIFNPPRRYLQYDRPTSRPTDRIRISSHTTTGSHSAVIRRLGSLAVAWPYDYIITPDPIRPTTARRILRANAPSTGAGIFYFFSPSLHVLRTSGFFGSKPNKEVGS